jgi:hypothetical protein
MTAHEKPHPSIDRVVQHAEDKSSLNMMYYLAHFGKLDNPTRDASLLVDEEAAWDEID